MESLESSMMHTTNTSPLCSTLPCGNNKDDEISKNLEDELLYGANEDVDEDDAQSDDSLRLRLSDDDIDDDIGASLHTDELKQPEKTNSPGMEFVHASNHCSMQHHENSSGMCSITSKHNGIKMELDLTDNLVLMKNNFCNTGEKNAIERGTSPVLKLKTVKYTYKNERKYSGSFESCSYQANQSFPVNQSHSDHSYHIVVSNRYGNRYYNQNSHYGQCRGYKFGEFNTYFNSFGLERSYNLRVYPPSRKVITETKYVTPGSNSQTNVSAIENPTHKDNSPSGTNDTQHRINIDTDVELITTDNSSPKLSILESSSDKLNTLPNSPEQISLSLNNENDPKEDIIVDMNNETMTCEIEESINSKNDDTAEKLIQESEVELFNELIALKSDVDDISENVTVTSVDSLDISTKNDKQEEIQEVESSASVIVVKQSTDNFLNDKVVSNEGEPAGNTLDENISPNDEPTMLKDDSEMAPNDDAIITDKKNDGNSKTGNLLDCSQHGDTTDSKEEEKFAKKRAMEITNDDDGICKKITCSGLIINEFALNSEALLKEISSSEAQSTIEKDLDLQTTKNETSSNKLDHESEKLTNVINIKSESSRKSVTIPIEILDDDDNMDKDDDKLEITAVIPTSEICNKGKRRRRKRKTNPMVDGVNSGQEKENVRQKRETAQKAEEMIRKRFLNSDSDSESSDNVPIFTNHNKSNLRARPSSPPSLKRICSEELIESIVVKKVKNETDTNISSKTKETEKSCKNIKTLEQVRKFFWRDGKKPLSKFTQEELEEILIQKVIETITMRDEIGKLREQARISERNQEATRLKCQQLTKQMKDFEMVLNRYAADRRGGDKNVVPIKINRSVGLQVNFMTDNGVQNLRQLEHNMKLNMTIVNGGNALPKQSNEPSNNNLTIRKGIKVRSPRRTNDVPPLTPVSNLSIASTQAQPPVTPAALVISKPTDNHTVNPGSQVVTQQGTITLNGALTATIRQPKVVNSRGNISNSDNLIDLTGEEEIKSKNTSNPPPLTAITSSSSTAIISKASPRYQRVIQPTSTNVTINQSAFKIVQPVDNKSMPTIVNNINTSRIALVMQNVPGPHQLLMAANTNPSRPAVTTHSRTLLPGITYSGVQTISNASLRVVPTTTTVAQKYKHPAPLPEVHTYPINTSLKLPPPAPSLKISKATNGIILSWNMRYSDEHAEIFSYQLFAYQEVTGMAPNTKLWKKVGDVRALPLPMACTLTQFSEGNNYYFAVRGVDVHSRFGQYSQPGKISL